MGGEINVDLTEDVTHLLVAKVGSQKYKVGTDTLAPWYLRKRPSGLALEMVL